MLVRRKYGRKVLSKDNKRRSVTIISHVNSDRSNNLNTQNSGDVKRTPNLPYYTVQNGRSSNTLNILSKINDT